MIINIMITRIIRFLLSDFDFNIMQQAFHLWPESSTRCVREHVNQPRSTSLEDHWTDCDLFATLSGCCMIDFIARLHVRGRLGTGLGGW